MGAAGAVDHDHLVKLGHEYFGSVPTVAPPGYTHEDSPSLFSGSDVRDYNDAMPSANFAIAFEGLPWTDPDIFSLMLCQTLFGVYATADIHNADEANEVIQIVQDEMVSLTTGVSDEELVRAKAGLKYNMLLQMDGTSPLAEDIGRQLITFGRRMNIAETFARIDNIDHADLKRVAEKVIWDQEVAFAAVGSGLKYVPDINGLRRGTYWNRL